MPPEERRCYECGQKGHEGKDCPKRKARIAQEEADKAAGAKKEASPIPDLVKKYDVARTCPGRLFKLMLLKQDIKVLAKLLWPGSSCL